MNTHLFSEYKQHSFPELNIVERNDGEEEEHTIEYRDGDVLERVLDEEESCNPD